MVRLGTTLLKHQSRRWIAVVAAVLASMAVSRSMPTGQAAGRPSETTAPATALADSRDFEQKVRPILEAHCIKCHGAGPELKDNFRLTDRASLLKGGDDGPAITLSDPDSSRLVKAIHYDGELKMPPAGKLSADEIESLTRWVRSGAPWTPGVDLAPRGMVAQGPDRPDPPTPAEARKNFWSVQPVRRPAVPTVHDQSWVRNPIDAFVLAKLEANGLRPAPPASRISLIRRATYDLTGLAPTPAEVDAFVADSSPGAYQKLVDRLLASPHYGEKWGRHWLDLVRYGESNSYERDNPKPNVWRYRDYVIRSFNGDKPYDRFVKEQLAGDELPDAAENSDDIIATGFYRLGIWDDEPSDRLQARYDNLDDIVTTTGQVFLGLTIDCARCHNHKIDPILQSDYYRLLAFFQNISAYSNGGPGDVRELFSSPAGRAAYDAAKTARAAQANKIQLRLNAIAADFRRKRCRLTDDTRRADIDDLAYRYYRDSWEKLPDFDNLKPETQGTLPDGLFDIRPRTRDSAFGFVFAGTLIVPETGSYTFHVDSDDGARLRVGDKLVIDYDGIHGLGVEQTRTISLPAGRVPIRLDYFQNIGGLGLNVAWSGPGFARRTLSAPFDVDAAVPPYESLARAIHRNGAKVLGQQAFDQYTSLESQLEELKQDPPAERALCVSEKGATAPDTFICLRGSAANPGDQVQPGFPKVLADGDAFIPPPAPDAATTGRRTVLANWITSSANPLFPRVMGNRLFEYHFGRGIVRSPNNYGVQGDRPTHPELLEWLASEFASPSYAPGAPYTMKRMHRLIMLSNAYQMSSESSPAALAADPRNDLLSHFDLRRLTAEEVRDSILAANASLNLEMYGPSVYPDIPMAVKMGQSVPGRNWDTSTPREANRRSVYVHVKRSLQVPILQAFDSAETDRSCPVRFVTVQPTQALGMLNGAFMNEQAQTFADRLAAEAGPDEASQVVLAFRLAISRTPTADETRQAMDLIQALQSKDGATHAQAMKYFCLMVLNLNEFVYLD